MDDQRHDIAAGYMCQEVINNPDATMPLIVPIAVFRNTTRDVIDDNIRANSARDIAWVRVTEPHGRAAVLCGGGPSLGGCIDEIRQRQAEGAAVFALNGAARFLRAHGVRPDAQVMVDARIESLPLLDAEAPIHFLASQVNPALFDAAPNAVLFHTLMDDIWDLLPAHRREHVPLIGGGASVGLSTTCLAYVLGYRELHCYGYDSSHAAGASHAYAQPMNDVIPTLATVWGDRTYVASVAMKAQAEMFLILARSLIEIGADIHVHGDGLLPAMFNTPPEVLTERDKYRVMWGIDSYRTVAPGEDVAPLFLEVVKPDGVVVDFGCGTGRGALALERAGVKVFLTDFAGNCRDAEANGLPFMEWDMTEPCPMGLSAPYGFCTDVMEHIPPEDVEKVLSNIFAVAPRVFFSIGTTPDIGGALIQQTLHVNVMNHSAWRDVLSRFGRISFEQEGGASSVFYVERA